MKNRHLLNDTDPSSLFLRKAVIGFLVLALIVGFCLAALYTVNNIEIPKFMMYMFIAHHILWLWGILFFKNMSMETMIMAYLSYMIVFLYPFACIFWNVRNSVGITWYLIIMIGAIVFQRNHIWLWTPLILCVVISVFFLSYLFPQITLSLELINSASIITVISTVVLGGYFSIAYVKLANIEASVHAEALRETAENTESIEKDKALYHEIIQYLEDNKPFKNPDFDAQELAKALNTNASYISKAISIGDSGDFRALINSFRINYAKAMLDSDAMKKYTIDYICTESGYKYRSTFNNAFKNHTGMTPSEYVTRQNEKNNQLL